MKQKCYYDSGVFAWFIKNPDEPHTYSIKNSEVIRHLSLFTIEETIQNAITNRLFDDKSFKEIWEKLDVFTGFFYKVEYNIINLDFEITGLFKQLSESDFDIKKKNSRKRLDAMDWFHLVSADRGGCEIFLTNDSGYFFLEKIKSKITFKSLKKVIIFNPPPNISIFQRMKAFVKNDKESLKYKLTEKATINLH